MPARVQEIIAEIDALLEPERFEDYCVNGLQVPGAEEVDTLATGVSAHAELFELAAAEGAQLLLVHHGIFWGTRRPAAWTRCSSAACRCCSTPTSRSPPTTSRSTRTPSSATTRCSRRRSEPSARRRSAIIAAQPIGCLARLPGDGVDIAELTARVAQVTAREPLVFDAGPARVRTLAIVSGAGADYLPEAAAAGAEALVTGEAAERTMALARESGVHLLAAGHHATETLGVRRLGEHLAERFGAAARVPRRAQPGVAAKRGRPLAARLAIPRQATKIRGQFA